MEEKKEIKEKEKERKLVCFPPLEEYQDMDVGELIKLKKKVGNLFNFIERVVRRKIQK